MIVLSRLSTWAVIQTQVGGELPSNSEQQGQQGRLGRMAGCQPISGQDRVSTYFGTRQVSKVPRKKHFFLNRIKQFDCRVRLYGPTFLATPDCIIRNQQKE